MAQLQLKNAANYKYFQQQKQTNRATGWQKQK